MIYRYPLVCSFYFIIPYFSTFDKLSHLYKEGHVNCIVKAMSDDGLGDGIGSGV